jgi:hypothetical protein
MRIGEVDARRGGVRMRHRRAFFRNQQGTSLTDRIDRPMIRMIRSLAAILLLSACATPLAGGGDDGSAARQLWNRQGIDDYRYVYSVVCFCPDRGPLRVIVRNGQVAQVETTDPNARVGQQLQVVLTVDDVFDRIEEARENGTFTEVEYHPTLGYPVSAEIGTLANDAGVRYLISDLVPLR